MKSNFTARLLMSILLAVFLSLFPLFGADRPPIDVNLIIDGSEAFAGERDGITSWVLNRLDQMLASGDRVTVWNAGSSASVIYSGNMNGSSDMDAIKKSIRELSASGSSADFSGALREAASKQSASYSYTLLISTSHEALTSVLASPQGGYLRYSRVEEFSTWRALVVGLNIDARVKRAAAAFLGS